MKSLPFLLLTLGLFSAAASANTLYWGGGTTNIPNGTLLPTNSVPGTWNLTTANWSTTTNGVTYTNWPSTGTANAAYLGYGLGTGAGNYYVTQSVNVALNQLIVKTPYDANDYTFLTATSPVSLTLNGLNPTITLISYISGFYYYLSVEPNVALAGTNGFTLTGNGIMRVKSDSSGLTGTVVLSTGGLVLTVENGGKLAGVGSFVLKDASDDTAGLIVTPPSASARDDLGDTCAVRLQGGTFQYTGFRHATTPSTETIGSIVLDSWGMLNISSANGSGQNGRLYTAIDRGPNGKGTLTVGGYRTGPDIATDVIVAGYPTGVILPWMQNSRGYALMLAGNGAITNLPWTSAPRDLSTWQPNQDYRSVPSSLSADPFTGSISTNLTLRSMGAELNGSNLNNQVITIGATNTLTVSSGYIGVGWGSESWGSEALTISGGKLTTTANDLYLFSSHELAGLQIYSAITGSINVVASGSGSGVTFGGTTENTYTGTTYVQGALQLSKPSNVIAIPGNVDIGSYGVLSVTANEQITNTASVVNRGIFQASYTVNQTFNNAFTNQGGTIRTWSSGISFNGPGTGFAFNGGLVSFIGDYTMRFLTDVGYDASSSQQAIFSVPGSVYLADGASATRTFTVADSTTLPAGASEMVVGMPFQQNGAGVVANLRKTGSGVLEMTARHTYTGTNMIDAGTLLANSARSTGYGSVIVTNSGTLGGTGIVLGAVSVYSGASLAPGLSGASVGTLTVSNNVNLKAGSTFIVDLTSSNNDLLICSNLMIAGYVSPSLQDGYRPFAVQWTIATVLGAGTIDKTGATTAPGYTLGVNGSSLILSRPSAGTTCFLK